MQISQLSFVSQYSTIYHSEPPTVTPTSTMEVTTEATTTDATNTEISVPTTQTPG